MTGPVGAARPSRSMRPILYLAAAAVCVIAAAVVLTNSGLPGAGGSNRYEAAPGALAPLFTASTADGESFILEDERGRPVLLNFWATNCAPCRVEMPDLQRVHEAFGDAVSVVGMNTGESRATVLAWAEEQGITFPLLLDPTGENSSRYELRGQPTTFVVDADGRVAEVFYGPVTAERVSQALTAVLTQQT